MAPFFVYLITKLFCMIQLFCILQCFSFTLALNRRGSDEPLQLYTNNLRKKQPIATEFSIPLSSSILPMLLKIACPIHRQIFHLGSVSREHVSPVLRFGACGRTLFVRFQSILLRLKTCQYVKGYLHALWWVSMSLQVRLR